MPKTSITVPLSRAERDEINIAAIQTLERELMTDKAAYTPGPWRLHDMETATVVEVAKRLTIACADSKSHSDEENAANARLIAAAPELLEACRGIYAGAVSYGLRPERLNINVSFEAFQAMESAIAKAEGR